MKNYGLLATMVALILFSPLAAKADQWWYQAEAYSDQYNRVVTNCYLAREFETPGALREFYSDRAPEIIDKGDEVDMTLDGGAHRAVFFRSERACLRDLEKYQ